GGGEGGGEEKGGWAGRPAGYSGWVAVLGRPPGGDAGALHATRIVESHPRARARSAAPAADAADATRGPGAVDLSGGRALFRGKWAPAPGAPPEQGGPGEEPASDLTPGAGQRGPPAPPP